MPPLHGGGRRGAGGAVWALQVRHVAVGQVGHEAAVREAPPQEIHGCDGRDGLLPPGGPGEVRNTGCRTGSGRVLGQKTQGSPTQVSYSGLFFLPVETGQETH